MHLSPKKEKKYSHVPRSGHFDTNLTVGLLDHVKKMLRLTLHLFIPKSLLMITQESQCHDTVFVVFFLKIMISQEWNIYDRVNTDQKSSFTHIFVFLMLSVIMRTALNTLKVNDFPFHWIEKCCCLPNSGEM